MNCEHVEDIDHDRDNSHLNGARLGTPVAEMVETNATGRGVTALVRNLYMSLEEGER